MFFESIREDAVSDSNLRQAALANTMESFGYVFRKALEGLFIDRMDQNEGRMIDAVDTGPQGIAPVTEQVTEQVQRLITAHWEP